jgi:hypothetical protein
VWNPAPHRASIQFVFSAKASPQRGLFVQDHEQVASDSGDGGVQQQRQRREQPRLPTEDQERALVPAESRVASMRGGVAAAGSPRNARPIPRAVYRDGEHYPDPEP